MNNVMTIEQAQQALDSVGAGQSFKVYFMTILGEERVYTGKLFDSPIRNLNIPFQLESGAIKSFNLNRVVSIHAMNDKGAYI
tara:strand:- start:1218 stop:1463 length:246 start_codon:yes stop_codon:yes gene_type:complete